MKRLVLMRHAKSSWDDERLADRDRPLSARGERDAPFMAQRLGARGLSGVWIATSPAVRALRTAEALLAALRPPPRIDVTPALYLASPEEILVTLAHAPADAATAVVVGHNPGLTELANRLLPDLLLDNLPTAGMVAISLATERWADAGSARATLDFYDTPNNARKTPN